METVGLLQIAVFILGSIYIILISRKSFGNTKVHGFYRFFVFELTLGILLLNIPYWITDPFSPQQIVSWVILFLSIYPIVASVYLLRKIGGSKERQSDSANFNFENTINLVTNGIYKHIRHPMYSSLLFLSFGAMLKNPTAITVAVEIAIVIFLVLTARTEEKENIGFFGEQYKVYMQNTKMFIPFIL